RRAAVGLARSPQTVDRGNRAAHACLGGVPGSAGLRRTGGRQGAARNRRVRGNGGGVRRRRRFVRGYGGGDRAVPADARDRRGTGSGALGGRGGAFAWVLALGVRGARRAGRLLVGGGGGRAAGDTAAIEAPAVAPGCGLLDVRRAGPRCAVR